MWIVHLQHKGELLSFPLDVYEVPELHTGEVLAWEFDKMLAQFNIQHKILSWTRDNTTSNDTQNTALSNNPNNFFPSPIHASREKKKGKAVEADDEEDEEGGDFLLEDNKEMLDLVAVSRSEGDEEDSSEENSAWDDLGATEREELLKETDTVKEVITKVCQQSLLIQCS
ncbi:hypothetical protein B0H14DRAFT_2623229 [Mycena olivaceomarginata]|nr:hypothetical protein B0H14DRAFT_2623229 [Mycena olivaceomarginata]